MKLTSFMRARNAGQRGYVLFTMAVAIIAICGFAGLVMDVGYSEYMRRQAQAAADAGAKAAAFEIVANKIDKITAAAKQDTANNGFTDQVGGVTITVNHPPLYGSYATKTDYAEVIVRKTISTTFMSILGFPTMTIAARGVGGSGPGPACIYVLDPAASGALTVSGSGSLHSTCGVVVNSSHSKAMSTSGSACVVASEIDITGNYSNSSSCALDPTPKTGVTASPDPLAYVPAPTVGACNYNGKVTTTNGQVLSAGVYCGGISVPGGIATSFNPGTYVIVGGGLTVSGGSAISGTGITFYNTYDASHTYKPIVVSGGSSTNLSAPTSGSLEGILFFQDRSISGGSSNTISGGSGAKFAGALYFPSTPLTYSGGSTTPSSPYTIIVALTLTISGNSAVGNDYSSLTDGDPIKTKAIVAE